MSKWVLVLILVLPFTTWANLAMDDEAPLEVVQIIDDLLVDYEEEVTLNNEAYVSQSTMAEAKDQLLVLEQILSGDIKANESSEILLDKIACSVPACCGAPCDGGIY